MRRLFFIPALLLLLTGCEESGSDNSSITLTSSSVVELYSVAGQSKKLTFQASEDWKAVCPADWVTFSPRSGIFIVESSGDTPTVPM